MEISQNNEQMEYNKKLKAYHKLSDRHVLVLETDLSYQEKCKIYGLPWGVVRLRLELWIDIRKANPSFDYNSLERKCILCQHYNHKYN